MRVFNVVAAVLILASFTGVEAVEAQTEKTVQGQYGPTPYITYAEFQDISVGGTVSGKSSSSRTAFRDVLNVASLDEVTRHFGKPKSTEYNRFPEGSSTDYVVTLNYEGINIKYRKTRRRIKLQEILITSEDRFLKVSGVKLQPGMSTDSLSAVMQKAVEDDDDGVAAVRVARPGKSEAPRSIPNGQPAISIKVDKNSGILKRIHFSRVIS